MKIKLIHLAISSFSNSTFPPYGLGILNQYLKDQKIKSEIFDLDVLIKHLNSQNSNTTNDKIDINYITNITANCNNCKINCRLLHKNKNNYNILNFLKNNLLEKYFEEQLEKIIKLLNIKDEEIIGFNVRSSELNLILALAKKIKKIKKNPIILGGKEIEKYNNISNLINIFKINYVDHFVMGDAFSFFDKLIENKIPLKSKKPIIHNDQITCFLKKCNLPLFNKEHLNLYKINPRKIKYFCNEVNPNIVKKIENLTNVKKPLVIPYSFQTGCFNNCSYCGYPRNFNNITNEKIIKDIEFLKKKYKTNNFYFLNTNLATKKEYTHNLMANLQELNIKWSDTANLSCVNEEIIKNFKKGGCIQLYMGFGTASKKLHNYVNRTPKNNFLKHYSNCFKATNKNNIWLNTHFITGLPFEKKRDIIETTNFLIKNKKYINGIFSGKFRLMKESPFFKCPPKFNINLKTNYHDNSLCNGISFNENNGLMWHEKIKQMKFSSFYFKKKIGQIFPNQIFSWYPIFLLYENFSSKEEIVNFLNK